MGVVAFRRLHARLMQIEPAAEQAFAMQPVAQLREAQGVVGVEQGVRRLRPKLQQQHKHDQEPRQHDERYEIRLTQQVVGHRGRHFWGARNATDAATELSFA